MRFPQQTRLTDRSAGVTGNCTQAAIAGFFDLPLESVPDFNLLYGGEPGVFWREVEAFFRARGFQLYFGSATFQHGGMYLAGGPTERTSEHGGTHMVVMQAGELLHDPHPSGLGLTSIDMTYHALPLDPAAFKSRTGAAS